MSERLRESMSAGQPLSAGARRLTRRAINMSAAAQLVELASVSRQHEELGRRRDELIDECIAAGHSERAIGTAARLSGPAINLRKKKGATGA